MSAQSSDSFIIKAGLARMLKGGVIMDVINVEQALIAEAAGAVAVMALERIPADIRYDGGVARMSDPAMILAIKKAVSIPVMAKARIGHFVEAQILEAIEIDYIDESEVLTMADEENHINKNNFKVPFVCGCRNLGEALRRIAEGAAMLRTKGEAGTGNVVEAVRHARAVQREIRRVTTMDKDELFVYAKVCVCIISRYCYSILLSPFSFSTIEHPSACRASTASSCHWSPSRRQLRRRWSGYTRRRRADDAAGHGRCLRWLWNFQVW